MIRKLLLLIIFNIFIYNLSIKTNAQIYTIVAGDVLEISVWHEAELTKTIPVRPDGNISFPLVGDVKAEGLSPNSLADVLKEKLSKSIKEPQVTVIIKEFKVKKNYIYLFGEVDRPGEYLIEEKLTLVKAISKAGGYKEDTADLTTVLIIKEDSSQNKIKKEINLKKFFLTGDFSEDVEIESGSIIYVPRIFKKVYVLGEVERPGVYNLEDDSGVIEAITNAGGYKVESADMKKIMVVRKGALEKEVSVVDLERFIELGTPAQNSEIKRGDIIYVPKTFNKVYVMGEVDKPGVYPLEGNLTAMGAITRAGGHKKSAKLKSVMLIRKVNDNPNPEIKTLNLEKIIKNGNLESDIELIEGDVIYVPKTFIAAVGDFMEFFFKNVNPALDTYLKAYEAVNIQDRYKYYRRFDNKQ